MSDTLIFATGCIVFAVTTLASLWAGYLIMQRWWVVQNPELTDEGDDIRPLFGRSYPEQRKRQVAYDVVGATAGSQLGQPVDANEVPPDRR